MGWCQGVAGDERAWLRGRLRTAWVQGSGWKMGGEKKPLGMSELGCADGCGRRACKECLKMGGEKKVLGMSELGCADGCGRRVCKGVAGEKKTLGMSELADGCGRRGCNGVAGNGWGGQAWKMVACRLAMCAYRLTD